MNFSPHSSSKDYPQRASPYFYRDICRLQLGHCIGRKRHEIAKIGLHERYSVILLLRA